MVVIPLLVYFTLIFFEFIPLYKQKLWRDFWVNSVLGLCSFVYAVMLSLGVDVPSPAIPIQKTIEALLGK